jgi:hypothetical protein
MTTKKGSIFLGLRKNRYGGLERIYYDPEYQSSPEFRKTLDSIAVGTGLIGGGLSVKKASRIIDNFVDSKFYSLDISRRNFLKTAAITAITGGLLSCSKEENPLEEIIEPPTPIITGPTELTIPHIGKGAIGTFDSAGTKNATDLYWQLIKPLSQMDILEQQGSEAKIDISFPIPGTNEVRLLANFNGQKDTHHWSCKCLIFRNPSVFDHFKRRSGNL